MRTPETQVSKMGFLLRNLCEAAVKALCSLEYLDTFATIKNYTLRRQ